MSRPQTILTFTIGIEREIIPSPRHGDFITYIQQVATSLCGGFTYSLKTGGWTNDTERRAEAFQGAMILEDAHQIELTCENHKLENVYGVMTQAIADAARMFYVDTDWIHVQEVPIMGRHFSVKEMNAAVAA